METIARIPVTATALWPSASDDWSRRAKDRQFHVEIFRTARGEFWVTATPRNPLVHGVTPRTNAIATEDGAREVASDLARFMRSEHTGTIGGPSWINDARGAAPICPDCEGIGTIKVALEGYGDRAECSCGYEHFYSIGD